MDILLLHEPRRDRIPSPDAIAEELQKLQQSGVVRAFGLAGGWNGISGLLSIAPELGMVVQTAEGEWPPEGESRGHHLRRHSGGSAKILFTSHRDFPRLRSGFASHWDDGPTGLFYVFNHHTGTPAPTGGQNLKEQIVKRRN